MQKMFTVVKLIISVHTNLDSKILLLNGDLWTYLQSQVSIHLGRVIGNGLLFTLISVEFSLIGFETFSCRAMEMLNWKLI